MRSASIASMTAGSVTGVEADMTSPDPLLMVTGPERLGRARLSRRGWGTVVTGCLTLAFAACSGSASVESSREPPSVAPSTQPSAAPSIEPSAAVSPSPSPAASVDDALPSGPIATNPATGEILVQGPGSQNSPPFDLPGGDYSVAWFGEAGCLTILDLNATDDSVREDIATSEASMGDTYLYGIPAGRYYIDARADCPWSVIFAPA